MAMEEILVGDFAELAEGDHKIFALDALEVGVFRVGDQVFAYENNCPHAGGPVCQGKIFNRVDEGLTADKKSTGLKFSDRRHIVCPWHGYEFDVETGCHPGDAKMRLRKVRAEVRDGQIYLRVPA